MTRRVFDICDRVLELGAEQAPVLLPAAALVFVFGAILATVPAALFCALSLVAAVIGLAWTSSPG